MDTTTERDTRNILPLVPEAKQEPQENKQPLPRNKHLNPTDLGVVMQINYRLHKSAPVMHKRFNLHDTDCLKQIEDFIGSHRAKAELKENEKGHKWVIVDKGLVDYMVITYIDQAQLDYEQERIKHLSGSVSLA